MPSGPITVIGATGQQGGAVVEALVHHAVPVRAATRNPNGDKARALTQRGVEVVYADLEDEGSVRAAFDGAPAAFAMTTHDGPDGPAREVARGRVIAAAAAVLSVLAVGIAWRARLAVLALGLSLATAFAASVAATSFDHQVSKSVRHALLPADAR